MGYFKILWEYDKMGLFEFPWDFYVPMGKLISHWMLKYPVETFYIPMEF